MYMRIFRFDELDSTNTYAKRNCSLLTDRTVICARRQTAGRGRLNRTWLSQEGGLYFSVVLKPQKTDFLANLTQLMALSACKSIQSLGVPAHLKWPNDVLINDKKLCGILSEAVTVQNTFQALVLGVGVNVRQKDLSCAGQPAVSLAEMGANTEEEIILRQILDCFFASYEEVLLNGFSVIRTDYLKVFPYIGKEVEIRHGINPARGTVQTISPNGELVLQTATGQAIISIGDMCL